MRIVNLKAENVKRLTAVSISPEGDIVKISGKNGAGKSSVLDAIWWALAGTRTHQELPIRQGEKRAEIQLDLGDMVVRRSFTEKGTSLIVENKEGARFNSPQAILDKMLGEYSFDPLSFVRMDSKSQYNTLRKLVKLEDDVDALESERKKVYEERTSANRIAASLKNQYQAIILPADCPKEEISSAELSSEMESIRKHNAANASMREAMRESSRNATEASMQVAKVEKQLDEARKQVAKLESELERAARTSGKLAALSEKEALKVESLKDIDDAEISKRIAEIDDRNKLARQFKKKLEIETQYELALIEADRLDNTIQNIDQRKLEIIENAEFPIEGLSIEDGKVIFNGLPIEQLSSAEQLRVSVAIAMNMNPKLRVIRITDGSLLDSSSMKILEEMAADRDFQIWVEIVDESGKVGVVIEDGHIAESSPEDL